AIAGPRDFQRSRNTQLFAGPHERSRVVAPVGLVEVDSQKIAGVILQQRIDAYCVLAGQMVVDHRIGQWDQQAIAAIAAFDARLFADTGAPLIGAGWCVARLAFGLALPSSARDIGAA